VESLKGASLRLALVFTCKGLMETNTLVSSKYSKITGVKSFIILGPVANFIKLFMSVIYEFS
jgi:hypothetical protein